MRRPDASSQRGAAVVEMAIVTILLLLLVTGIIDLGRAIYTNIGLQDAAEEGAIYVSYNGPPVAAEEQDYKEYIAESTSFPDLVPGDVDITCENGVATVTVAHTVDLITPFFGNAVGGSLDLSQTFEGDVFLPDDELAISCPDT